MKELVVLHNARYSDVSINDLMVKEAGYNISYVTSHAEVIDLLKNKDIDELLIPAADTDLLIFIKQNHPLARVLITTKEDSSLKNILDGHVSFNYIKEPYSTKDLLFVLDRSRNNREQGLKTLVINHFLDMSASLSDNSVDISDRMNTSLSFIGSYIKADAGSIMLLNEDKTKLDILAALGENKASKVSIDIKDGLAGWIISNNKSILINSGDRHKNLKKYLNRPEITSSMSVMIESRKEVLGILNLNSLSSRKFSELDIEFVSYFAEKLAYFIEEMFFIKKEIKENLLLKERNEEMEAFVYSAFHDLKTPLFTLQGFLDAFKEYSADKLDDKGMNYLRRISNGARKLEHMIKDVFEFFKFGKLEYQKEKVDMGEVLNIALDQLQMLISKEKAHIKRDKNKWPFVEGDQYQLVKVWVNLIGNAMKYKASGRSLNLELGFEYSGGDMINFFVKDNGIGIDPRLYDYVFKIFSRIKEKDTEGTGVGLSIVKKIVNHHGGNIWLTSEQGKGSTFYFTIPKFED